MLVSIVSCGGLLSIDDVWNELCGVDLYITGIHLPPILVSVICIRYSVHPYKIYNGWLSWHPAPSPTMVPKKIQFLVPKSGFSYRHFTADVNDSSGVVVMLLYIHSDILITICYHL